MSIDFSTFVEYFLKGTKKGSGNTYTNWLKPLIILNNAKMGVLFIMFEAPKFRLYPQSKQIVQ